MDDDDAIPVTKDMRRIAHGLACAYLHAPGDRNTLHQRCVLALGKKWPWLKQLVRDLINHCGPDASARTYPQVLARILAFPPFLQACANYPPPRIRRYFTLHPVMEEAAPPLRQYALPVLHTQGDLAAWLGLTSWELENLADYGNWRAESALPPTQHYRYLWKAKARGGHRLIEIPKPRLREVQRKILRDILDHVPPHTNAHGGVRLRSPLSATAPHLGRSHMLKIDLADFFPSIHVGRVYAIFRTLGYTATVSQYLSNLCTHTTPVAVLRTRPVVEYVQGTAEQQRFRGSQHLRNRHLPQGAPTSPALANLSAFRLDLRMSGAAAECGISYTRYVDDLIFSADAISTSHMQRIALMAHTIILEEGFQPHHRKTKLMTQAQAQTVCGLVVNAKHALPRSSYDTLKAVLTNCIRHGPASQNRQAHADFKNHLRGRIERHRQVNVVRGERLHRLFEQIAWESPF